MKKSIDLIIDGVAPEKVMYDTDNHSLVVLYPAQEEFKVGDKVILKSHSMRNLSSYNGFTYFEDMNTSNGSYIVIEEVKINNNTKKQARIYGTNSVTGKGYFYPIEWLEHYNVEFKKGDILTAVGVGHDKSNMTFIYNHFSKYSGHFEALCGGVQINPATKKSQLRDTWFKYGFNKDKVRHATPSEIEQFDNDLKSIGKRWNRETLEVEDIVDEFKRGDIVYHNNMVSIFSSYTNSAYEFHGLYNVLIDGSPWHIGKFNNQGVRIATTFEQQILFDALAEEGKKWNRETLEIEELDISEIVVDLGTACKYLDEDMPDNYVWKIDETAFERKINAQIELQMICKAWNKFDGFVVDFKDNLQAKYYLEMKHYSNGTKVLTEDCYRSYANMNTSCYSFKTRERAKQFGNQFKELFKTAMGIL